MTDIDIDIGIDLHKILRGGQRMARVQNGVGTLWEISTSWVGRTNVTDER